MEKVVNPNSWNLGERVVELVKVARNSRLVGADYTSLVKRAGEEAAWRFKNSLKMVDGEVPIHMIAMGSTEGYGPNRNGDGFKEAMLERCHPSFVSSARIYRHHKNKDKAKSYGIVKDSFYNKPMRRVELFGVLNGNEKVASDNGGLLADEELNLLKSGKDYDVSMAIRVPYDVCSGCGNKAKNRSEYCDTTTCKYGGCKHNLTKVADDGHILHVDNPDGEFFDISRVGRGADRNAFAGLMDFSKTASGEVLSGAELAEMYGLTLPLDMALRNIHDTYIAEQIKLAYLLADQEDNLTANVNEINRAFGSQVQPPINFGDLRVGSSKFASALAALSGQKISLPVRDFLTLALGGDTVKAASFADDVSRALPGVYNRLIASGDLEQEIRSNPFKPSQSLAPASQRQWAESLAEKYSLDRRHIARRVWQSSIRGIANPNLSSVGVKYATAKSGEVETLARRYATYKLAFLASQTDDMPLTCSLAIRQNYVI